MIADPLDDQIRTQIERLAHRNSDIAGAASARIVQYGQRAVPYLLDVMAGGSDDAKIPAALALGSIGGWQAVESLIDCALMEASPVLRASAVVALGMTREQDVAPTLQAILEADPDEDVKQAASSALIILRGGSHASRRTGTL